MTMRSRQGHYTVRLPDWVMDVVDASDLKLSEWIKFKVKAELDSPSNMDKMILQCLSPTCATEATLGLWKQWGKCPTCGFKSEYK